MLLKRFLSLALATALCLWCASPACRASGLSEKPESTGDMQGRSITFQMGDAIVSATLAGNASADALLEKLSEGPITIDMRDYGNMEKVGDLGFSLPQNNEQMTTQAGDLILYQGSSFVIYYAPNAWVLTRLGWIDGVTADELYEMLGEGEVTVTLSLE